MLRNQDQGLYMLLDSFLNECIINNNSILTDTLNCFTIENINDCIVRFVDNNEKGKQSFEEKFKIQFNNASDNTKIVFAHANWMWAYSVNDMTTLGKKAAVKICLPGGVVMNEKTKGRDLYPVKGFGSAGTYHKQNKYWEIASILMMFKILKSVPNPTVNNLKSEIEKICLYAKYDETENPREEWQKDIRKSENSCAMHNILLYLCKPDSYERIASDNHKHRIVESFSSLLSVQDKSKTTDEKILVIRNVLKETTKKEYDFYDEEITVFWNPLLSDSSYNEIQGLSLKKNIILYGPPGTGKTYTAKSLAKTFIIQKIIEIDKNKVKDYLNKKIDVSSRIRQLQLHSNYSYEDFIAGITLRDSKTEATKGYFYLLCEEIIKDKDKTPYVLIIDEINRVDLSRLFGEAFSAIESRNEEIDLSLGRFKLIIPDNLYIIGTMNEIDFSLERLDFALRRRFVWFHYGYNEDMLKEIIYSKAKENIKINKEEIYTFIDKSSKVNKKIDELNELGKQYEIGHTFFAEVIDIANQFAGRPGYVNKINLFKANGPIEVLWNISIAPIIEAFLGNLDENQKSERILEMRKLFINGK